MSKQIPLSQGLFATVDNEDFEYLMQWKWYAHKGNKTTYAERMEGNPQKVIKMHVQIMNPGNMMKVDHKDLNGLNNQRCNLRVCTHAQNSVNDGLQKNNKTGFKGVCFARGKFHAGIKVNYKRIHLGVFQTAEEAAKAYDQAAKKYFGEYARTNF